MRLDPPSLFRLWGPALISLALSAACAPRGSPTKAAQSPSPPGTPSRTELSRTIITPTETTDIEELFRQSEQRLAAGDAPGAAAGFDRIVRLDPSGPRVVEALHQGGLAHEQAGDRGAALTRFEQAAGRFAKHALGRESLVRAIRLLCFMERWKRAGEAADTLIARHRDLDPFESIVAQSAKALARLADGDVDGATYHIEKGRNVIDAHRLDQAGAVPRDLAQLYFALGEARRMKAEKIRFVPMPADFAAVLEERCQLLLDAQSAYSDAMRAYDAHWSAMAGYRVGELYQRLHEDLMAIPAPKGADTDARVQLFEGAMRLRYSILLDKALTMMEHTLSMASRTGEKSQWVDKAEDARAKIDRARRAEQAAIDKLPYTRAELQAALDDLAKKKPGDKAPGARTKAPSSGGGGKGPRPGSQAGPGAARGGGS